MALRWTHMYIVKREKERVEVNEKKREKEKKRERKKRGKECQRSMKK